MNRLPCFLMSFSFRPRLTMSLAAGILGMLPPAHGSSPAIPPAEQLLPADTFLVFSVPDSTGLAAVIAKSPQFQFWHDPAMKPSREKFTARWKEELLVPLERDLGVAMEDFAGLLRGQLTVALTREGWQAQGGKSPAFLLLLDAKDRKDQLTKLLADLRRKWVEGGKPIKTEKLRDVEFTIVPVTTNDVPRTLRPFFPRRQEVQELGREPRPRPASLGQLMVGQHESLLIVGTSSKAVEKVMARLTGGTLPPLAEEAAFEASRLAAFRGAPLFGWFHAASFFEVLSRMPKDEPNPLAPSPVPELSLLDLVMASGLPSLKTTALAVRDQNEGISLELHLGAPETSRQGVLRILSVEAKDATPPPFVPAEAVKFQRWRVDGPRAVATLEKMIRELSPSMINTWNYVLESGEAGAKLDDPAFDLRRDLVANLGDDLILYEKSPRGITPAELESPPSLLLIGSPNAEKLADSLRALLVLRYPDALRPEQREFLGRKVYHFRIQELPPGAMRPVTRRLSYAASGGYVAMSMDVATLEEYLRGAENPGKSLRDTIGLVEAAQMVGGQRTGMFYYENQSETMRVNFEAWRKGITASGSSEGMSSGYNPLSDSIPYTVPERSLSDWMDYTLLPGFDAVAKYFHFTVAAGSANVEGMTFKYFFPTPPPLK